MAEVAKKLRESLRSSVRAIWSTDEGFEMSDKLADIARKHIEKEYERCAREVPAKEYPKCLKQVAESVNLEKLYEEAWGTR